MSSKDYSANSGEFSWKGGAASLSSKGKENVKNLLHKGTKIPELKELGYTVHELKNACIGDDIFKLPELRAAGFTAAEMKAGGYNWIDIKHAGYTAVEIHPLVSTPGELHLLQMFKSRGGYTAADLKASDLFSCHDLKVAGFTALECQEAGYTVKQLKRDGNFTATEIKPCGFSIDDLRVAGYTVNELHGAGYTNAQLREAFPKHQLEAAGLYDP